MIAGQRVLALIPARGGSKGLPGKNTRPLCGKPLIAWSIETARNSVHVDHVLVSTDSAAIADVSERNGSAAVIRPPELATDHALVADAIRHAVKVLEDSNDFFDLLVLLQPTSPIRPQGLLDECVEELLERSADSLATFSALDVSAERLWTIKDGVPKSLLTKTNPWLPRQQLSDVFQINGLIYVFRVEPFMQTTAPSVLFGHQLAKVTPKLPDIDTLAEFEEAERILNTRQSSTPNL